MEHFGFGVLEICYFLKSLKTVHTEWQYSPCPSIGLSDLDGFLFLSSQVLK